MQPRLGPGAAYATANPRHLLNVRIENMSAFADEPDHFVRWLAALPEAEQQAAGERSFAGTFVRRQVYGAYVQHLLEDSITRLGGGRNLHLVPDEATALRPIEEGLLLETAGGRPYRMDAAVLALGNFPPDHRQTPGYFGDPWHDDAVRDLRPGRPVLLIGSGLTMIDVCLALLDKGFGGPIFALSRRGLLPHAHDAAPRWDGLRLDAEDRRSLASLCRAVRREARRAAAQGFDWRFGGGCAEAPYAAAVAGTSAGGQASVPAPSPVMVGDPPPSYRAVGRRADRRGARARHSPDPEWSARGDRAR